MADNRSVEAEKILFELTKEHEGHHHAALRASDRRRSRPDRRTTPWAHLNTRVKLFPRNVPVTVRYAESLIAGRQPRKKRTPCCSIFSNNVPPTPEQIRLTANRGPAPPGMRATLITTWVNISSPAAICRWPPPNIKLALQAPNLSSIQRLALPGTPGRGAGRVPRDGRNYEKTSIVGPVRYAAHAYKPAAWPRLLQSLSAPSGRPPSPCRQHSGSPPRPSCCSPCWAAPRHLPRRIPAIPGSA